jgi:hypothetical protein
MVFVTTLQLPAAIVEELQPVWVCCGWRIILWNVLCNFASRCIYILECWKHLLLLLLFNWRKYFKCFILIFVYLSFPNLPAPSFLSIRTLVQYSDLRTHYSHFYESILPREINNIPLLTSLLWLLQAAANSTQY